ncbi:MAG: hypothetical protein KC432_04915 [Thermomicrobiales bacterium]|nr:hypothetical protein [Thermomicrobiales bacterium]
MLEARGQPERSLLQSVLTALEQARCLLVPDYLEHRMGSELQSLVNRRVQEYPGVRILTTSRVPLHQSAGFTDHVADRWLQGELNWKCGCSSLLGGHAVRAIKEFDQALVHMDSPTSETERAFRANARSHRGAASCLPGDNDRGAQDSAQSVDELRQIAGVDVTIFVFSDFAG